MNRKTLIQFAHLGKQTACFILQAWWMLDIPAQTQNTLQHFFHDSY